MRWIEVEVILSHEAAGQAIAVQVITAVISKLSKGLIVCRSGELMLNVYYKKALV
jgi:hypothetical protein